MIRKIMKINEELCNGCGACATACHEGAIEMVAGKARLTKEDYCDGLGDCLPACPTNAITFEEREAPAYNEAAVLASKVPDQPLPCGCPGTQAKSLQHENVATGPTASIESQLQQWQIHSMECDYHIHRWQNFELICIILIPYFLFQYNTFFCYRIKTLQKPYFYCIMLFVPK